MDKNETPKPPLEGKAGFGLGLNPCFTETIQWTNIEGSTVSSFLSHVEVQRKRSEDRERKRSLLTFNIFSGLEAMATSSELLHNASRRTSPSNCANPD